MYNFQGGYEDKGQPKMHEHENSGEQCRKGACMHAHSQRKRQINAI